jgi:hypothetical protein
MAETKMTTYKRADGELICGEYGWIGELDHLDDDEMPVELVEEVWVLAATRTFWQFPTRLYGCYIEDCDEDASVWEQDAGGVWREVCEHHRQSLTSEAETGAP